MNVFFYRNSFFKFSARVVIPVISLNGPVFPTENETNIITPYLSTFQIILLFSLSVNSYFMFSYFFTILLIIKSHFIKNQAKHVYLIQITSLTSIIDFIHQETTEGLFSSPSTIIYKLFHYAQSLPLHFGCYLQLQPTPSGHELLTPL